MEKKITWRGDQVEQLRDVASSLLLNMEEINGQVVSVQPATGDARLSAASSQDSGGEDSRALLAGSTDQQMSENATSIKVFTLNVWGLWLVAKDRLERFKAIADFVNRSDYDVVFMQELWLDSDFNDMKARLIAKFPHSHFFDTGIIGSGTCVFSKHRLQEANFHEFSINGYPTNFWHGDWFAAKGIGVCQIDYKGYDVHLYVSHYHANYKPDHDIYLSHRVNHAFESALWIKLASSAADLTIYAGDFNSVPSSLPYRLLRAVAPLEDCWEQAGEGEGEGETSECGYNSYTVPYPGNGNGKGNRIDYVMYCSGPNVKATTTSCRLPVPRRVPNREFSYTDHEGVEATIELARTHGRDTAVAFRRGISTQGRSHRKEVIEEAVKVMDRALAATHYYQTRYLVFTSVFAILLIATFIPSFWMPAETSSWLIGLIDVFFFVPRFIVTIGLIIFSLMGTLFTKRERNANMACKKHLTIMLESDF